MPGIIVVGSQWGDEGKGKVVDVFSAQADLVVRYQGGANAGHTLVVNGIKTVLHLVPSGILHAKNVCVIAAGVVLDLEEVVSEIRALKEAGLIANPEQLRISDQATVLLSYHRALDQAREIKLGQEKIGTTGRGIGPAYEDRASRKAILFSDLFNESNLRAKLEEGLAEKNFLLKEYYKVDPIDSETLFQRMLVLAKELAPYRCKDSSLLVHKALRDRKKVLFEGAQGTMLDLQYGTYPFVTSSSTIAGSAFIGSGVGPHAADKIIGITKAYTTRVGSGPFPTEIPGELGERIRRDGGEFGATTGRARRCGWLDLVALKYAIRVNGITNIALMKLDVLSGHEKIDVCTSYRLDGQEIKDLPTNTYDLSRIEPVYRSLAGWSEDLTQVRSIQDLPQAARDYIQFIGNELATPIDVVSVGPGREQTLWIKPLFN
ncbi:MAG: adenylosuccinate synthase [Proteobacteria bacterium]|nr:MAG: adenylosuccinate synthase [Pseudomonadota bacterium]